MFRAKLIQYGLLLLATLYFGVSLPAAASADVIAGPPPWWMDCNQIDYSADVLEQVQFMFIEDDDTLVCILKHIKTEEERIEVGIYLGAMYPSRLEKMLREGVRSDSSRKKIRQGVKEEIAKLEAEEARKAAELERSLKGPIVVLEDVCGRIHADKRLEQGKTVFTLLRTIVNAKTRLRSNDVACILREQPSNEQHKIADFIVGYLADPENYGVISQAMASAEYRALFEQAVKEWYANNKLVNPNGPPRASHPNEDAEVPEKREKPRDSFEHGFETSDIFHGGLQ